MHITDPVADMLTRIRNANNAKHETVDVPASNMKKSIAQILLDEGYIKAFQVVEDGTQGVIRITLKYNAGKEKVISGLRRVSKPGLRVYVGVGVDDGLHRGTIQGAVGVHCHLTGGIGNLLHSNKNFHFTFYLLNYLTPRWLEMTMRWTSEVPS